MFKYLIVFLFFSFAFANDDVIDLSNHSLSDFKNELTKQETALVDFFAPWCRWSKALAPEFAKAATVLKSNNPSGKLR